MKWTMKSPAGSASCACFTTSARANPINPGLTIAQLEERVGTPREQLEFCFWYLKQRRLVLADDRSTMTILTEGIDFIEENLRRSQKVAKEAKEARRPGVERAA